MLDREKARIMVHKTLNGNQLKVIAMAAMAMTFNWLPFRVFCSTVCTFSLPKGG